jgi:SAM-dependent methyltransferase
MSPFPSLRSRPAGEPAAEAPRTPLVVPDEETVIDEVTGFIDRTAHIDMPNWRACAEHFRTPTTVQAQWRMARGHLRQIPRPETTVGLDLGCWCGFMTWMFSRLGAGRVWGSDVIAEHVIAAQRWTSECGLDRVHFRANGPDRLAYEDGMFDWVVTSGLYSNLNPEATAGLFAEIRRVLKPGGTLLFNDGGNILHEPTRQRIDARYREVEWGDGDAERPTGVFFRNREEIIRAAAPGLEPAAVAELAANTCYQHRPAIEAAARRVAAGDRPADAVEPARFDPAAVHRPPIDPYNGNSAARANDPWRIRDEILAAGFAAVRFRPHGDADPVDDTAAEAAFAGTPGVFLVADRDERSPAASRHRSLPHAEPPA